MSAGSALLQNPEIFELLVSLIFGAIAAFLAIISWTKTTSLPWILVISGILASYAGLLYRTLRVFGFFTGYEIHVFGSSLGSLLSGNIPNVFFITAFIVFLSQKNWR